MESAQCGGLGVSRDAGKWWAASSTGTTLCNGEKVHNLRLLPQEEEKGVVCHQHTNLSESSLPDGQVFVSRHSEWERRWGAGCAPRGRHFRGVFKGLKSLAWFRALMRELPGRPGRIEWLVTVESENLQSHRQKTEETRYNKHLKKETGKSL